MTGFLGKEDLRQLTGAARQARTEERFLRSAFLSHSDVSRPLNENNRQWFDRFLLLPTVERIKADERTPGRRCGVYMLFNSEGGVNYIGQSQDVGFRITEHLKGGGRRERLPFVEYGYVEVPPVLMLAVEITHIHALKPMENKAFHSPCWRFHDEAVKALRAAWGKGDERSVGNLAR